MSAADNNNYRDDVAELLGKFTVTVSGRLDPETRRAAKRALGDSVAVALGALDHPASHIARKFAAPFATPDGDVIWGTSMRANPDLAAFVNGSLLRCFDYNDFYVGDRNSGHPSDIVAGVVAAAEWVGASGEELLVSLAVGYEVVGAVFDAFSTAPGGWDYTNLTGIGACAAIARLLKLDVDQAREAFGITVIPHFASDEVEILRAQPARRPDALEAFQRLRRGAQCAAGLLPRTGRRRGGGAPVHRQQRLHRQA